MSKKLFTLCLLILIAKASFSQTKFRLGLNAAPSYSWLKPDVKNAEGKNLYETKGTGVKIGFAYGLSGEFVFGDNYSFATGIFVSTSGGGLKYQDSISIVDTSNILHGVTAIRKHHLQYIEIPLTVKLKTNEIGYITYYGKFGIGPSILIKARADDEYTSSALTSSITHEDIDIQKEINFFRASLIIGGGIEYSLGGNTAFVVSIIYNNGFTNIFKKTKESIEGEKVIAKSKYIALTLGVLF